MAMTKVKSLQLWCKKMCEGYRDVNVVDMSKSWKDGLAFCAIIHRFRPDLIDFDSLSKENIFENNQLAFSVAENELDIPALLEAPDMVAMKVPDKLSVVTYVSQYYNYFHDKQQLGGPGVKKAVGVKRHQENDELGPVPKRLSTKQSQNIKKTPAKERQVSMGDKCTICHEKVYLLERHVEENKLYHRTCFRRSDLSPTNKIYDKPSNITPNRKTDDDNKSQSDFWTRRAEARKKEKLENKFDSAKSSDISTSKVESKAFGVKDVNTPSGTKDSKLNSFLNEVKKDDMSSTPGLRKSKPGDLNLSKVDNFKTNHIESGSKPQSSSVSKLKQFLKSDSDSAESDKKTSSDFKTEQFHPKPVPRHSGLHEVKDKSKDEKTTKLKNKESKFHLEEKMDTSESLSLNDTSKSSRPIPVPRHVRKSEDLDNDILKRKHDKMKSPTTKRKSPDFLSISELPPGSPSPPPLPSTAPPPVKTTVGSPPHHRHSPKTGNKFTFSSKETTKPSTETSRSSGLRPFSPLSTSKDINDSLLNDTSKNKHSVNIPPAKPKRISALNQDSEISQGPSPMEVDDTVNAYLVTPKPDAQQDKQVLGGLLKSLANVRRAKSPEHPVSSQLKPMEIEQSGSDTKSKFSSDKYDKSKEVSKGASDKSDKSRDFPKHSDVSKGISDKFDNLRDFSKRAEVSKGVTDKSDKFGDVSKHKGAYDKSDKLGDVSKQKGAYDKSDKGLFTKHSDIHKGATDSKSDMKNVKNRYNVTESNHGKSKIGSSELGILSEDKRSKKSESHITVKTSSDMNKDKKENEVSWRKQNKDHKEHEIPSWKQNQDNKRPKSADLLSISQNETNKKTEWQIEAEKRKAALEEKLKKPRAKSEETVLDKKQENAVKLVSKPEPVGRQVINEKKVPPRPKSADLLKDIKSESKKPDWQIEAEKRITARHGEYVDPEMAGRDKKSPTIQKRSEIDIGRKSPISPITTNVKINGLDSKKGASHISSKSDKIDKITPDSNKLGDNVQPQTKRRVLPTPPKEELKPAQPDKKKISLGMDFKFDIEQKPSRPPPIRSPVSPRSPVNGHAPPPRPPPPRKEADKQRLSPLEIQEQLVDIDDRLTKLEVRGRQLEDSIRKDDSDIDSTVELIDDDTAQEDSEDETQMIEWFKLVNEKNELVRKEADLIYASRQQELEDEQHEIDQRVRHLMSIPESEKTEEEKQEEEYLVQKLIETVNQRSLIVDSQDEDRIRYEQEDKDIAEVLKMKGFMVQGHGDLKKQKKKKGKR